MFKLNQYIEDSKIEVGRLNLSNPKTHLSNSSQNKQSVVRFSRFVNSMPFEWITSACKLKGKAAQVALAIWDLHSLTRSPKVALTSKHLLQFGIQRHAGYRALQQLESANLIIVERKIGKSPRIIIPDRFLNHKNRPGNRENK